MSEIFSTPGLDPEVEVEDLLIRTEAEDLLTRTFELSGHIKPFAEATEPMERTGLLPSEGIDGVPTFVQIPDMHSTFVERSDQRALNNLYKTEAEQNSAQQEISRLISAVQGYSPDELDHLHEFARKKVSSGGLPKELEILRALVGGIPKEGIEPIVASEEAYFLANDVYWLRLKEQEAREGQKFSRDAA